MPTPFTTYKLIILYMLDNAREAITNAQISEFVLEKEYTNYFQLQQALSELVEAELLRKKTVSNASFYALTEDGKNALRFFEKDLSPQIREEIAVYLKDIDYKKPERILCPADYYTTPAGGFAVRCQLIEKGSTIIDLNMAVPGLEAAKSICENWAHKSQDIYANIMEELL